MAKKLPPVHPGEILREEFLVPLKLTPYAVAAALNVPRTRIERIAREEKPVTADTALDAFHESSGTESSPTAGFVVQ
jgi:antitoxin HigA-1